MQLWFACIDIAYSATNYKLLADHVTNQRHGPLRYNDFTALICSGGGGGGGEGRGQWCCTRVSDIPQYIQWRSQGGCFGCPSTPLKNFRYHFRTAVDLRPPAIETRRRQDRRHTTLRCTTGPGQLYYTTSSACRLHLRLHAWLHMQSCSRR